VQFAVVLLSVNSQELFEVAATDVIVFVEVTRHFLAHQP
jgi:hypothetical protein